MDQPDDVTRLATSERMMAAPCVAFTPVPSGSPCSCPGVASLARSVEVMTCNEDPRITSTTAETGRDLILAALRVTSSDHGLPTLRVTPGDLAYLAEGADHMVVRLLGLGQVLRLRKTDVGSSTSREDLILRAKKDEEFFKNVARPFLSPLLTDESHLVIVEPAALMAFKETVEARRPERRRGKEINKYGVAWICPDAASAFSKRRLPTDSISSDSSLTHHLASTAPFVSSFRGRSPSPRPPACSWEGLDERRKDPLAHAALPEGVVRDLRESHRASSTNGTSGGSSRDVEGGTGTGASSRRPQETESAERSLRPGAEGQESPQAKVICVEIKPKQGYIDHSTPGLPMCVFCINQYVKPEKCRDRSRYCPQDLFSGDLTRMRRAVDALIQSPQTNLKVFVDGEAVEDIKHYSYLRDVIISALTHDFESPVALLPQGDDRGGGRRGGGLSPRSPLGRTLAFQMLDQLGVLRANALYRRLAKEMGSAKDADAAIHDLRCWTGDGRYCQLLEQCGRCWHSGQPSSRDEGGAEEAIEVPRDGAGEGAASKCKVKGVDSNKVTEHGDYCNNRKHKTARRHKQDTGIDMHNLGVKSWPRMIPPELLDKSHRGSKEVQEKGEGAADDNAAVTRSEMVRRLQEFLLATTAKDLSLMVLLSGPHTNPPPPATCGNVSPFPVALERVWYMCQVTGVDLIAKPPSKIRKRERDHKKQADVLRDLIARGAEPSCCKP
ncbi:uncharacterized protein LOC119581408 [Penaeus monodon]|uniref:uncharacterized protein LOC119581408 n=1 Tax=Penaeus monodon TaxID=6687 RepID=UPI0018A77A86|nr:uncharacterized protein LOC119581408 [Penaeus monodon]